MESGERRTDVAAAAGTEEPAPASRAFGGFETTRRFGPVPILRNRRDGLARNVGRGVKAFLQVRTHLTRLEVNPKRAHTALTTLRSLLINFGNAISVKRWRTSGRRNDGQRFCVLVWTHVAPRIQVASSVASRLARGRPHPVRSSPLWCSLPVDPMRTVFSRRRGDEYNRTREAYRNSL